MIEKLRKSGITKKSEIDRLLPQDLNERYENHKRQRVDVGIDSMRLSIQALARAVEKQQDMLEHITGRIKSIEQEVFKKR